jgi:hypothetical protein
MVTYSDVLREGPDEPYYFGLTTPSGRTIRLGRQVKKRRLSMIIDFVYRKALIRTQIQKVIFYSKTGFKRFLVYKNKSDSDLV